jgi:hypothetical protein
MQNLAMLKIKFNKYSDEMNAIKTESGLVGDDVNYESKKTVIINNLNNLNTDIHNSFDEFSKIVASMRTLATPEIFKLRASISQQELEKKLKNMSTQQQELYKTVIAPQPLIDGANDTTIQNEVEAIQKEAGNELQEQITDVNTSPQKEAGNELQEQITDVNTSPQTGGKSKSKKRTSKSKKRTSKSKKR